PQAPAAPGGDHRGRHRPADLAGRRHRAAARQRRGERRPAAGAAGRLPSAVRGGRRRRRRTDPGRAAGPAHLGARPRGPAVAVRGRLRHARPGPRGPAGAARPRGAAAGAHLRVRRGRAGRRARRPAAPLGPALRQRPRRGAGALAGHRPRAAGRRPRLRPASGAGQPVGGGGRDRRPRPGGARPLRPADRGPRPGPAAGHRVDARPRTAERAVGRRGRQDRPGTGPGRHCRGPAVPLRPRRGPPDRAALTGGEPRSVRPAPVLPRSGGDRAPPAGHRAPARPSPAPVPRPPGSRRPGNRAARPAAVRPGRPAGSHILPGSRRHTAGRERAPGTGRTVAPGHLMSEDTRTKLLAGALEALVRNGIAKTSARSIAAAAGVNQGLIFYHFGSVDELLAAACRYGAEQRVAHYRPRFADVRSFAELVRLGRELHAEVGDACHVAGDAQLLARAQTRSWLASASAAGLELWSVELEGVLDRVVPGTPIEGLVDTRGLARALASGFIGLELYEGVDHEGAERALEALERLGDLVAVLDDLGPVARRAVRARLRSAAGGAHGKSPAERPALRRDGGRPPAAS